MERERSVEEPDRASKREVPMGAAKMLRRTILGTLAVSAALGVPIRFLSLQDPAFQMGSVAHKPQLTGRPTLGKVTGLPS